MGSAYAGFQERELGSIQRGKLADMVVWDRDFYAISADEIKEAKAELSILEGKIIYKDKRSRLPWQD